MDTITFKLFEKFYESKAKIICISLMMRNGGENTDYHTLHNELIKNLYILCEAFESTTK